jgi:hypothetical protein
MLEEPTSQLYARGEPACVRTLRILLANAPPSPIDLSVISTARGPQLRSPCHISI